MTAPILHGPAYSTYVRTARLALEEKGVAYRIETVNTLKGEAQQPDHLARHPFGKVPAFEHDGFALYETSAIARYIDEAFPGPALQPSDPRRRARMNQIVAIVDAYLYGPLIGKVVIQRLVVPLMGGVPDETAVSEAMPQVRMTIGALEDLAGDDLAGGGPFLVGSEPTLADLYLVPIFAYADQTPEGGRILADAPRLARWWRQIADRPSVQATQAKLG